MYKSIIFDIGGVLVDFDPKAYLVDRLCNAEMEEKVYDLTFGSEEWQLLDAGKLSRYDGNQRMLEHARAEGCAFEVQGVLDDWMHILRPRLRMLELVRRLKNHGYCVYYLSNIPQVSRLILSRKANVSPISAGLAGSCRRTVSSPFPRLRVNRIIVTFLPSEIPVPAGAALPDRRPSAPPMSMCHSRPHILSP